MKHTHSFTQQFLTKLILPSKECYQFQFGGYLVVFSSSYLQYKYFRPFKRPVTWLEFQFKLYFDYADVQLLMSSGLETEPPISSSLLEEEETCSHGNGQSQADSIGSSANGPQVETGQHGEDRKGSTVEPEAALKTWTGQSSMNSDAGMGVKFNNL